MHLNVILSMGGYGLYVWSAYGMTFAVFGWNFFVCLREKQRIEQQWIGPSTSS